MDKRNIAEEQQTKSIYNIYYSFIQNIDSIQLFFEKFSPVASTEDEAMKAEKSQYLQKVLDEIMTKRPKPKLITGNSTNSVEPQEVQLSQEDVQSLVYKLSKAPKVPAKNLQILTRGAFIMLNNTFEFLFSDLLFYHFKKNSNIISSKKVSISLNELQKYLTIEDALEDLIYKEVEGLILELTFDELKTYFKEKLKINLEEEIVDWDLINEIRERRHIIIHNNAIVNSKYISRTINPFSFKLGHEVTIQSDYFVKALAAVKIAGSLILFNCWGKWDKGDATQAIEEIKGLTFDLLKQSKDEVVIKVCQYAEKNIVPANEQQEDCMLRIRYNHCIAAKRIGESKLLQSKLNEIKVGIVAPIFKMAHALLKDDHDSAIQLMPIAKIADGLTLEKYLDWPLFEWIRKDEINHRLALKQLTQGNSELVGRPPQNIEKSKKRAKTK